VLAKNKVRYLPVFVYYVILLDYAGTYVAQVAFINEGATDYDEALDFIRRTYDIAEN